MKTFKVEKIIPESSHSNFKYHFHKVRVKIERYDIFSIACRAMQSLVIGFPFYFHFFFSLHFQYLKKTDH
jgi:hypothetical protein